jgi:hypothetical protein
MPRTLDRRIEAIDIDDGRKIVMLRPGWAIEEPSTSNACHTFGADTNAEIRREMKMVQPCDCPDCRKALAGSGKLWS